MTVPTRSEEVAAMADRWRIELPENVALPPGRWIERDIALDRLMAANGTTDRVKAQSWVIALLQAGRLDCSPENGSLRLLPDEERTEFMAAERQRLHLEKLRREMEELGVVVPVTTQGN